MRKLELSLVFASSEQEATLLREWGLESVLLKTPLSHTLWDWIFRPQEANRFFVHYQEASEGKTGSFKLVRVDRCPSCGAEQEVILDEGPVTKSPSPGALFTTPTFYANGQKIPSFSFHCEPEESKA